MGSDMTTGRGRGEGRTKEKMRARDKNLTQLKYTVKKI
jgi:hypothetical protein